MAIFYFLYSSEYDVTVLGFSHFNLEKGIIVPEKDMKDAYETNICRHDTNLEAELAKHLYTNYTNSLSINRLSIHKSNFIGNVSLKYYIDNCELRIFIIGDSHNRIFKHMPIKKYMKVRSATTMLGVYRDGIEELLNPNHERVIKGMESEIYPHQGDVCLFSFGYVDILNNILKDNTPIEEMVDKYINEIIKYADDKRIYPIVQVDTVAQPSDLSHTHTGSITERIKIRNEMYECLKKVYG